MQKKLACLLIVVAGFFSFGLTLKVGFLWDDPEIIVNNPHIKEFSLQNIRHSFTHDVFNGLGDAYYRPLVSLANMIDHQIWGLNPFGYHLTNLTFHILAAVLLFLILSQLLTSPVAFLTSVLFSVHPIVVEQLIIVAGRMELMALAFTFAALLSAMKGTRGGKIFSVIFFALACLSKESGMAFPFLLLLIGWFEPKFRVQRAWYAAYTVTAVIYFFLRSTAVTNDGLFPAWPTLPLFFLRDLPMILVDYLRILAFPFDLHSHRRMEFNWPWLFASLTVTALILLKAFVYRSRLFLFCLGWFLFAFLPKIPLFMTNALMLDHWAYPSNIGVLILIATGLNQIRSKTFLIGASLFLVCFFSAISWANILGRNTEKKLYLWSVSHRSSSIVRTNLGLAYLKDGDFDHAERWLKEGLERNPNDAFAINGLALTYWRTGRTEEALKLLEAWLKVNPTHDQSLRNRALIQNGKPL